MFCTRETILWTVTKNDKFLGRGDTVYIWRSMSKQEVAGVVARALVLEPPSVQEDDAPNLYREGSPGAAMRCRLQVLDLRLTPEDGMVTREQVKSDPLLASHVIVKAGNATNFRLSTDQLQALDRLWDDTAGYDPLWESTSADDLLTSLSVPEGRRAYKVHLSRERNRSLVEEAKRRFRAEHGRLYCEVCGFDFADVYGSAATDFIEAHHNLPISEMKEGDTTRVEDLSMLCSNCHQVIHLRRPWLNVQQLRAVVLEQRNASSA